MINFENVEKSGIKYKLLYKYCRFVHNNLYYSKFYILNKEKIPEKQAIVLISNHQNGLSDAMGLIFALRNKTKVPVFIARADIFKKKLNAKLLRFLRIMPAYRQQDTGKENLGENEKIFSKSARILLENGVVGLFPEAGHEDCHHLGTFKKGFARIAFQAAEMSNFEKKIYILPCSNHYSNYFGFQNKLIITIGEAFTFDDLYPLYKEQPKRAQKLLADRARTLVKPLMLDIEDKNLYEEFIILKNIYAKILVKKRKQKISYYPNIFEAEKDIVNQIQNLKITNEIKFNEIIDKAHKYTHKIDKIHLNDIVISEKFNLAIFLFRFFIAILITPFLIYGFINNFFAYYSTTLITRRFKDQMLHSSFAFGFRSLLTFPLCYFVGFALCWFFTGIWWIALIYFISLPLSLVVYLRGKSLWQRQLQRFRKFRYWLEGFYLYRQSVELRNEIITELDEIFAKF